MQFFIPNNFQPRRRRQFVAPETNMHTGLVDRINVYAHITRKWFYTHVGLVESF